jgi:hypothetical protein
MTKTFPAIMFASTADVAQAIAGGLKFLMRQRRIQKVDSYYRKNCQCQAFVKRYGIASPMSPF